MPQPSAPPFLPSQVLPGIFHAVDTECLQFAKTDSALEMHYLINPETTPLGSYDYYIHFTDEKLRNRKAK